MVFSKQIETVLVRISELGWGEDKKVKKYVGGREIVCNFAVRICTKIIEE